MAERATSLPEMELDEFLAWDDGTGTLYELAHGQVVAMNPATAPHAALVGSAILAIGSRLPRGCLAYAAGGVIGVGDNRNYRVPDVVVSCVPSPRQWVSDPTMLIEVISPANRPKDVLEKLDFYHTITTVMEVVCIWPTVRRAQLYRNTDEGWTMRSFIGNALLPLACTTEPVPLDDIYERLGL